jgi:hypothetical protein
MGWIIAAVALAVVAVVGLIIWLLRAAQEPPDSSNP